MIRRHLLRCIATAALLVLPQALSTANGQTSISPATSVPPLSNMRTQAAHREAIRQMPILERPNRPGHFYGNTVRRLHARRMGYGY
ncbi:MAG TPA: hypothetical protein VE890_08425 [Thermoguttaceae bacterium]|nr:hypothetical protein [Thermoguttaceae bacterium]